DGRANDLGGAEPAPVCCLSGGITPIANAHPPILGNSEMREQLAEMILPAQVVSFTRANRRDAILDSHCRNECRPLVPNVMKWHAWVVPRPAHAISSSVMFLASEMARMHHPPAPRPSRRSVILSGAAAALLPGSPLRASENRPMLTITEPAGKVRELSEQDIADLAWHEIATRTR